ncbi:MAG TPA: hypothetical protein VGB50_10870 [Flavobacterium sp.]|jgi:hypothetical protein
MRKSLKIAVLTFAVLSATFFALLSLGIIWRSPKFYTVKEEKLFKVPIMDMRAYDTLGDHVRPYLYEIRKGRGAVYVIGIEHTKDINNMQIPIMNATWNTFQPDVAFVEGRLGFLFEGLQDPVKEYGEGGLTLSLAKEHDIPFYTWEPQKSDELKMILKQFTPQQAALFYSLRPYFSNFRFGKPADPDASLQELIDSRTDMDGIRGAITSVAQVDSIWKADFPKLKDWRDTSDEYGWPDGYLLDIFSLSNQIRDVHLCSAVIEAVNEGQKVFVTMGSSHAFRIEKTLRAELEDQKMNSGFMSARNTPLLHISIN